MKGKNTSYFQHNIHQDFASSTLYDAVKSRQCHARSR